MDSDNDGIPDVIEYGLATYDTNDDGVLSSAEILASGLDTNGNGSVEEGELTTDESDSVASLPDFDGDGIPDARDLDADDDGLPDMDEAGPLVSDLDVNNDNQITEAERAALGGDGVVNLSDLGNADNDVYGTYGPTGGGYRPNYIDRDSDNDGIADLIENGRETCDTNDDGYVTNAEGFACPLNTNADNYIFASESAPTNTDATVMLLSFADVTPDYLDLDSDGDGIADWIEAFTNDNIDPLIDDYDGSDGFTDGWISDEAFLITDSANLVNTDGTGNPDYLDTDADDDGILDAQESGFNVVDYTLVPGGPHVYQTSTELLLYANIFSTDNATDNIPDFRDLDSDNDGVIDAIERGMGSDPLDSELDGEPDFQDLDSDEDGLSDEDET
ncbi:MAG TPA: hypothetical protein PKU69_05085, partial [Bacillota bacterium]|nr:hypothetical protein [Bacillota bacterium]